MRARTVAQVIAAEAGGKTYAQRLSAMRDIASAVLNRANALGVSPEDVVGVTSEFNAYNNPMPAGTSRLTSLAEQAMADVMSGGVTHNGMFYAREYATKNLPKGLKEVKKAVDGHVYFTDPKARAIRTAVGVMPVQKSALPQTVAAIPSPAPRATPQQANALGMSAVGETRDFMSSNMARVAKAAGTPPSTYAARITAPTPNSSNLMARTAVTPSDARMRPDISVRMADTLGNNSLTGGASADTMAARMSPMEPGANIAHLTNTRSFPAEIDAATARELASRPSPPDASSYSGPGSRVSLSDVQRMSAAPQLGQQALGHALMGTPPQIGVALGTSPAMTPADRTQATWERIAPTSQDMALAHLTAPALGSTFPVRPDIIAPNTFSNQPMLKAPELQASVPPQPEIQQPQVSRVKTSSVKRAPLTLNVTKPADPFANKTIGGIKPDERFSVDSIDSAIGGPRGATFSASPGLATFSRGPNIGYGVHNAKTGMTTLFDPSGNITGARRDKSTGGGFLGGLFGGGSSSSGKSLGGGGGGYGSSGNGSGGFGIGGAGSTRSR